FPSLFQIIQRPPPPTPFPYTTLFRSPSRVRPFQLPRGTRWLLRSLLRRNSDAWRAHACLGSVQRSKAEPQVNPAPIPVISTSARSEEHTSELQSLRHLVCRLLLEKKN